MLRKSLGWYYWLAMAVLLSAALAGLRPALAAAIGLGVVQTTHYWRRTGSARSFPVQVRACYLALLALGAWPPLAFVHWIQFVGTWTMVTVDYCFLARCLSLAPWNRRAPLSWALVRRTFLSPPYAGSVLDRPAPPAAAV